MLVWDNNVYRGELSKQGSPTEIQSICSIYALHSLGKHSLPFVPEVISSL